MGVDREIELGRMDEGFAERLRRRHEIDRPLYDRLAAVQLDPPGRFFDDPSDDICIPDGVEVTGTLIVPEDFDWESDL